MKTRFLTLTALLALSFGAQATLQLVPDNVNTNTNANAAAASANAGAVAGAVSGSVSTAIGGDSRSTSTALGGTGVSGSQSGVQLNIQQSPLLPEKLELKTVPSVYQGSIYPTAACSGSSQVGGAGVGFGFSVGTSWTDDECSLRETARSFGMMGRAEDALAVLCSSKFAAAAPACVKPTPLPAAK